jgi:hypothetical protein
MSDNIDSEFLQVKRDATSPENHRVDLSTGGAILPVYTIYDRGDVPIEKARVGSFINPISKGEDRREHHEKPVAGCRRGKCTVAGAEAAP